MPKLNILFLCTGNSYRSPMAEGWARHRKGDLIEPYSAGIEKHGMDPCAVCMMAEVPVMLSVCKVCNASRGWYQRQVGDAAPG